MARMFRQSTLNAMCEGSGNVIALDILPMEEIPGALVLQMDFSLPEAPDLLKQHLKGPVDVVLSDMAPSSTGHRQTDHIRQIFQR